MAKKKANKSNEDNKAKADLSNLFSAAKSSLTSFSDLNSEESEEISKTDQDDLPLQVQDVAESELTGEVPPGASVSEIFDDIDVARVQESLKGFGVSSSDDVLSEQASLDITLNLDFPLAENESMVSQEVSGGNNLGSDDDGFNNDAEPLFAEETPDIDAGQMLADLEGTELESFDSAEIEDLEFIEDAQLESVIESVLFATDRPVSLVSLKQIFKGTNVTSVRLKQALSNLQVEFAGARRGVTLEEVGSGFQLRTKIDNLEFMRRSFKAKSFKLSGPALEVLAIVAYKQPVVKAEIDEIRGVESGHLLRALMEKNLVLFAGKSDLPGKPMQYATARKFLEIFGLRNLKELPTLSQIDELLPEGISDEEEKPKLADITDDLSQTVGQNYSEGEEELSKITDQLQSIETSSEFFEKEKQRQKDEKDAEKARNIREAQAVGEKVPNRDLNWLKRYDDHQALLALQLSKGPLAGPTNTEGDGGPIVSDEPSNFTTTVTSVLDESDELERALRAWDSEVERADFGLEVGDSEGEEDVQFTRTEDNDIADIDEEVN